MYAETECDTDCAFLEQSNQFTLNSSDLDKLLSTLSVIFMWWDKTLASDDYVVLKNLQHLHISVIQWVSLWKMLYVCFNEFFISHRNLFL